MGQAIGFVKILLETLISPMSLGSCPSTTPNPSFMLIHILRDLYTWDPAAYVSDPD